MAKRISDRARMINFAFDAESREAIDAMIESLSAIRNRRFPTQKAERKSRAPKAKAEPKAQAAGAGQPLLS